MLSTTSADLGSLSSSFPSTALPVLMSAIPERVEIPPHVYEHFVPALQMYVRPPNG